MNFGEILGVVLTPLAIIAILVAGAHRRRSQYEQGPLLGVVLPPNNDETESR